jgi:mRNA interferase MazF
MVKRGEIWWVSLPDPLSSEPGYKRPVVIIQSDSFNKSKINTIICAVLTSNLKLKDVPGNILLPNKTTGLPKDSVINISQIITIDKSFLEKKAGELTRKQRIKMDIGLKIVLSLNE